MSLKTFFLVSVLFLSVAVFLVTSSYFLSDSRRLLITSIRLYQPSFLYAYAALLMQGGVVQVRQKLKAKGLNMWTTQKVYSKLKGQSLFQVILCGVEEMPT